MRRKAIASLVVYAILVTFVYAMAFGLHLCLDVDITPTANQLSGWFALGVAASILVNL